MDLRTIIGDNQFLSGGLVLGGLTSVVLLLKTYARSAVSWLWHRYLVTIEVRSSDPSFEWLETWLDEHPYSKRARRLTVRSVGVGNVPTAIGEPSPRARVVFSPSVGSHFLRVGGRFVWVRRERKEADASKSWERERETFHVTIFGQQQDVARELIHQAHDCYDRLSSACPQVYQGTAHGWLNAGPLRQRPIESVVLPAGDKETFVADLERFVKSERWYTEMGIPYRRGYLFSGVSGSGKSSLVAAVASTRGMNLCVLNLSSKSDSDVADLLASLPSGRAIVLIEDIDTVGAAHSRAAKSGNDERLVEWVTFAGLSNALDGVASRHGLIIIMTTNYPEKLDHALVRPGRVDMELRFRNATAEQALELYRRFYGDGAALSYGDPLRDVDGQFSMATLQEHFLRYRHDPKNGARLAEPAPQRIAAD